MLWDGRRIHQATVIHFTPDRRKFALVLNQLRISGPSERCVKDRSKDEGSTIPVVVGKAARAFFKGLDRKQRFDANKGLTISCTREAGAENEG